MEKYIFGKNSYDIIKYDADKNIAEVVTSANSSNKDPNSLEYTSDIIRRIFVIGEDAVVTIDGKDNHLKEGDCVMLFKTFRGEKVSPIIISNESNSEISKLISNYVSARKEYYKESDAKSNSSEMCLNEDCPTQPTQQA